MVSRLAAGPACSQKDSILDLRLLEELDHCYKDDLKQRFRRNNEEQPTILNATNPGKKLAQEDEWEYWSIRDSILFSFSVITTIGCK